MGRRSRYVRGTAVLLVGCLTGLGQALALDEVLVADVLEEIESGDLSHARELLETHDERDPLLNWVLALAEQQAGLEPRAAVLAQGRALRATPADLPFLRRAQRALGTARSYLEQHVRAAYHAIGPGLSSETLQTLSRDPERRVRRLAVSALAEQLGPMRQRVHDGVCLDATEQRAMSDPTLVQLLIDRLGERELRTDRIPADLAVRSSGTASALHALVLIEAAALPSLELQRDRPGTSKAIAAIHSAVTERLRRYPRSTWYCADGEHVRTHGLAALHCGRPLPAASRYCALCGEQVRQTCSTCGELLGLGADYCPSCGGAATDAALATRCDRCGIAVAPESGFCPQCGQKLGQDE